ncbi:MAG: putative CoA-binding protein [Planctomycetota bacterium]|jgi:predicted CoA-binding protein
MSDDTTDFLAYDRFVVAGASTNRMKYGNKVLRCYLQNGRDAIGLNPRATEIEGVKAIASLSDIERPKEVALSIITPPKITEQLIAEAIELGISAIWMQPGAESPAAIAMAEKANMTTIHSGPCLLVVLGYRES